MATGIRSEAAEFCDGRIDFTSATVTGESGKELARAADSRRAILLGCVVPGIDAESVSGALVRAAGLITGATPAE